MPVTLTPLQQAVVQFGQDKLIDRREARTLVVKAKESGSAKPIDDIFEAIRVRTEAAITPDATRVILAELDQPMSHADWVAYAQRAASPSGMWAPSEGAVVAASNQPPAIASIVERWNRSAIEDKTRVTRIDIAGKPLFMLQQSSDYGTTIALFDERGTAIDVKEDSDNVRRNAKRVQELHDRVFGSDEMKAWKDAVQPTELGVITSLERVGTFLDGARRTAALKPALQREERAMLDVLGSGGSVQLYRNKKDGSLLLYGMAHGKDTQLALFSKSGTLVRRFTLDWE